jgi:hypothetical protein
MKVSHLFAAALLLACCASLHAKTDRYRVVWEQDPATTAVIGWNQAKGKNPVLYYDHVDHGTNVDKYSHQAKPDRNEKYLGMDSRFVTLKNLKPNSPCYFVIADSDSTSPRLWFRTAPDSPQPFTFIGGGDTKSDTEGRARGRKGNVMVSKLRPLFVLYAGDFTSKGLKEDEWKNWLADWSADTTSSDGRVYPIVPVRGNHEPHPDILYRLFGLSDPKNYFAFNVGGDLLRLYALNSQIHVTGEPSTRRLVKGDKPLDTPELQAQTKWLINDLKNNPGPTFKIASYHKPLRPHTSSKPENDYLYDAWAEPFHKYGVDAAIEGDSHMHKITYPVRPGIGPDSHQDFIRDDETGTIFMGEGSWGAKTRADDNDKPWTLDSAQITQFKWFHVHPNRIEIRTVLTENAEEVDSASDENPFALPEGLQLHAAPNYGTVIRIPFSLNNWHDEKLSFQGTDNLPSPDEVVPYKNIVDEQLRMHFFYPKKESPPPPPPPARRV